MVIAQTPFKCRLYLSTLWSRFDRGGQKSKYTNHVDAILMGIVCVVIIYLVGKCVDFVRVGPFSFR